MGSMYELDSTVQDINVSAAYGGPCDRAELDPDIHPKRAQIEIEYVIDPVSVSNDKEPLIGAWVFDPELKMEWIPLDGPVLGFLRIFAWYDQTIGRYSNVGRNIFGFRSFHDEIRLHMLLYTATNKYSITGHVNLLGDGSYLGCIATGRTPRPGEEFAGGGDLADGKFSRETWNNIVGDMLSFELMERQGKQNKYWGLFPDDPPGMAHSNERRLGYVLPARATTNGSEYIPQSAMRPFR